MVAVEAERPRSLVPLVHVASVPDSIAFYRKFGFEIVGEHTFMLGLERQRDILMAARID